MGFWGETDAPLAVASLPPLDCDTASTGVEETSTESEASKGFFLGPAGVGLGEVGGLKSS